LQYHQASRLLAALGHGEEGTGAEFAQLLLVEHLDLQRLVVLGQLTSLLGHEVWVAVVRWQVAQVAGQRHAGGDGAGLAGGTLEAVLLRFFAKQDDLLQCARIGLLALETIELVLAVSEDLDQQARGGVGIAILYLHVMQRERGVAAAEAFQRTGNRADDLAPLARIQVFGLAGADQQQALGLEPGDVVQQQRLGSLAAEVAALEDGRDGASCREIDAAGVLAKAAVVANGQNQRGSFQRRRFDGLYNEFHDGCPQDKESGLQDNAGLVFRWFVCRVVGASCPAACRGGPVTAASLSVAAGA